MSCVYTLCVELKNRFLLFYTVYAEYMSRRAIMSFDQVLCMYIQCTVHVFNFCPFYFCLLNQILNCICI